MRRIPLPSSVVAAGLLLAAFASPASAQTGKIPTISARQFVSGSAKLTVTGTVQFDQDVPINAQASIADGEMTWLQFGASGSATPNVLITYQPGEVGVSVGRGKFVATAGNITGETPQCSGTVEVTATSVSGNYTCLGVASYDASTGKMGKVDIKLRFTTKS